VNVFNRVLVVLLAVALLVGVVAVLLVSLGGARPADLAPAPWFADRLGPFAGLDGGVWTWTVGVCVALGVAAVLLLVLELRPGRRAEPRLTLKRDGLGAVTVTRSSVNRVVDHEAGLVPGVTEVHSRVDEGERGLRVVCRVAVEPTADIPALTAALQERVKAALEHSVGRPVAEVRVDAHVPAPRAVPAGPPARRQLQ
jgi:hypothetical protein